MVIISESDRIYTWPYLSKYFFLQFTYSVYSINLQIEQETILCFHFISNNFTEDAIIVVGITSVVKKNTRS